MNRITQAKENIQLENRIGIMTHVVVGYPSIEETQETVIAMAQNGADFIELQIPFSDPIADGPTILKASQHAIDNGTTVQDVFTIAKNVRGMGIETSLIAMTYANIALSMGIESFIKKSIEAGIDGFIIPDLPLDSKEGKMFFTESEKRGGIMIPLYAPTMNPDRYSMLSSYSNTLVYAVSRTGVTGTKGVSKNLEEYIQKIRNNSSGAIALGFGIQSIEQIKELKGLVDIAVVGSHLLTVNDEVGIGGVIDFLKQCRV